LLFDLLRSSSLSLLADWMTSESMIVPEILYLMGDRQHFLQERAGTALPSRSLFSSSTSQKRSLKAKELWIAQRAPTHESSLLYPIFGLVATPSESTSSNSSLQEVPVLCFLYSGASACSDIRRSQAGSHVTACSCASRLGRLAPCASNNRK